MDMLRREDAPSHSTTFITAKVTTSVNGDVIEDDSESETWNFS